MSVPLCLRVAIQSFPHAEANFGLRQESAVGENRLESRHEKALGENRGLGGRLDIALVSMCYVAAGMAICSTTSRRS